MSFGADVDVNAASAPAMRFDALPLNLQIAAHLETHRPGTMQLAHAFTKVYCNVGNVHQRRGKLDEALRWQMKALAIEEQLAPTGCASSPVCGRVWVPHWLVEEDLLAIMR